MFVNAKGQVAIPKHICMAVGITPGSQVSFGLLGDKIVMTPFATGIQNDRRRQLRAAAARVRGSLAPEFKQLGTDEIMSFLRSAAAFPNQSKSAQL